eukprot:Skav229256  [mRNA]  locus=scaffold2418:62574:78127:- [translate_table: standard]
MRLTGSGSGSSFDVPAHFYSSLDSICKRLLRLVKDDWPRDADAADASTAMGETGLTFRSNRSLGEAQAYDGAFGGSPAEVQAQQSVMANQLGGFYRKGVSMFNAMMWGGNLDAWPVNFAECKSSESLMFQKHYLP